jgi:uncharacterized alpha/beta hydrolase family protein
MIEGKRFPKTKKILRGGLYTAAAAPLVLGSVESVIKMDEPDAFPELPIYVHCAPSDLGRKTTFNVSYLENDGEPFDINVASVTEYSNDHTTLISDTAIRVSPFDHLLTITPDTFSGSQTDTTVYTRESNVGFNVTTDAGGIDIEATCSE